MKKEQVRKPLVQTQGIFKTGGAMKSGKDKAKEQDKKLGRKNFAKYVEECTQKGAM